MTSTSLAVPASLVSIVPVLMPLGGMVATSVSPLITPEMSMAAAATLIDTTFVPS